MKNSGCGNIKTKKPNGDRGWFFGFFKEEPLKNPFPWRYRDFQIKWAELKANDNSDGIKDGKKTTTISILVRGGPHQITLYDEKGNPEVHNLDNNGDFVFWGPDIKHSWKAIDDNMTITLRWKESAFDS